MIISQRDIVEVPFFNAGHHPAIVVSTPDILVAEGFFYGVVMSTKNHHPDYSYPITFDMINNPRNFRNGFALCHLIQIYYVDDIISRSGATLKTEYFKQVIAKVNEVVFDFK